MQCRECRTRASSRESMVAMVQMFIDKGTSREDAEKMVGDKTLEQFLLDNKDSLFPPRKGRAAFELPMSVFRLAPTIARRAAAQERGPSRSSLS